MSSTLSKALLTPWIYHGIRLFIGCLFLYTGATKLADTAGFAQSIEAYGILPAFLVPCAAFGLPVFELAAGLGTVFNRRWGILAILAMMILFTGVLGYGTAAGLEIDCGCFSTSSAQGAKPAETTSILEIPSDDGTLNGGALVLEPVQEPAEEACGEGGGSAKSLLPSFIRDLILLAGALYLAAWPDMRRRVLPGIRTP